MAFGVYIHIPYCIQRCGYCDFATYQQDQILPPPEYFTLLKKEISQKSENLGRPSLSTIYFGGGTPSLVPAEHIVDTLEFLKKYFDLSGVQEITLEINPATLNSDKMQLYLSGGINRFSVGAQSFNDHHLKKLGREHSSQQTIETLSFLKSYEVNYNFDLLFGVPHQTLEDLSLDLDVVEDFLPHHVSPYCLTLQESHPLNQNRPSDEIQEEMFHSIRSRLQQLGYDQYEISNFARPGFESKHNSLYWSGDPYLGFGLSSHSYLPQQGPWGLRFWNPRSITQYAEWVSRLGERALKLPYEQLPEDHFELLEKHQALTDLTHTSLRTRRGLDLNTVKTRFGERVATLLSHQIDALIEQALLEPHGGGSYRLTAQGVLLSNQVFRDLTYLTGELD